MFSSLVQSRLFLDSLSSSGFISTGFVQSGFASQDVSPRSVFGLVSLVSLDCAAPWRLQVNSELRWFHFGCPLMLLLLYNAVAGLRRNQVGPPTACRDASVSLADRRHAFEQLVGGDLSQNTERAESTASQSYDMTTATSDLSDEVISTLTAETRRQLWRRTSPQVRPLGSLPSKTI